MSFLSALPIIGSILKPVFSIIDKAVEDKDEANRIKAQIQTQMMSQDHTEVIETLKAQSNIIIAEAQGKSWLQRNWRPLLMLVIIVIIANNFIFFPYASLFTDKVTMLELPPELYKLMFIGVGGYIVSRGGEKVIDKWKRNPTE